MYHVYKLHLSDAAASIINTKGWQASPEGQAYKRLSSASGDTPSLAGHVLSAALMGLYHHGLTVEAPSMGDVFDYDNGAPFETGVKPIYHCKGLRSMSVGDVIMGDGHVTVCCSYGWKSLPDYAAAAFAVMAKQIACQRHNALPQSA